MENVRLKDVKKAVVVSEDSEAQNQDSNPGRLRLWLVYLPPGLTAVQRLTPSVSASPIRSHDLENWKLSHPCWRQGLINPGLILDFLTIARLNTEQLLRVMLANALFLFDLTRKRRTAKEMRSWVYYHPLAILLL